MKFHRLLPIFPLLALPLSASNNRVWDGGAADWDFANAVNWVNDVAPADNDYGDNAVFDSTSVAGTVNLAVSRKIRAVYFQSSGWTLSGQKFTELTVLQNSGAGANTMEMSFNLHQAASWNIASGSTLNLTAGFYERNYNVDLSGGGTLGIGSSIGGYGGTVGAWGINITDASTVRFDTDTLYGGSTAGAIFISSVDARLQILSSVSYASGLIGTRIQDNTGMGLQVTDIGGGYVEVSAAAIPEPATAGLFAGMGALGLFALSRRRRRT